MKRWLIGLTSLMLTGCASTETTLTPVPKEKSEHTISSNLETPWAIEYVGDTFYITERPGHIVKVQHGDMERQDITLSAPLATVAEAGLLGFALAPDFTTSDRAFAYYTYESTKGQFNRIVELRYDEKMWHEEKILLDHIPSGNYHYGGRLKIGPDHKLYATVGDASDPDLAQQRASLAGKILRLNLDGSIPDDNPSSRSYVYSYGHRNPQGLVWLERTLYASEHGDSAHDEINRIEAGKNYGWPTMEGNDKKPMMETPLFTSGADTTWAPSGMAASKHKLYVAALRGSAIIEFDVKTKKQRTIVQDVGRIRDVMIIDDTLYFITNNRDGRGTPQEGDDRLMKHTIK